MSLASAVMANRRPWVDPRGVSLWGDAHADQVWQRFPLA